MIDNSFLSSFSKDFPKEITYLKGLINSINEIKTLICYFKNSFEVDYRESEALTKSLPSLNKNFNAEVITQNLVNEENSNLLSTLQFFINLDDTYSKQITDDYLIMNNTISDMFKPFNLVNFTDICSYLKESQTIKAKNKGNVSKVDKSIKELGSIMSEKKKEFEKGNYNMTNKSKIDDRVIRTLNDYSESSQGYQYGYKDLINIEKTINEFLHICTDSTAKFIFSSFNKFKFLFNVLLEGKITMFSNLIQTLTSNSELIVSQEIIDPKLSLTKFADLKQLKYTDLETIDLEKEINKSNFANSNTQDVILSSLFTYNQFLLVRKKVLQLFIRYIKDKLKVLEEYNNKWQKNTIKAGVYPKINLISNDFIIQMSDIFRSVNDVTSKKTQEINKYYQLLLQVAETHYKEVSNEESNSMNLYSKYSKDFQTMKETITKNIINIEKIQSNLESIKMEISSNCDDPSNFTKFEAKLHNLRIEENNSKENTNDLFKKYYKAVEECLNSTNMTINKGITNCFNKSNEIKNCIVNLESQQKKVFDEIKAYIDVYKGQFFYNGGNLIEETKKILYNTEIINLKYFYKVNQNNNEFVDKYFACILSYNNLSNYRNRLSISEESRVTQKPETAKETLPEENKRTTSQEKIASSTNDSSPEPNNNSPKKQNQIKNSVLESIKTNELINYLEDLAKNRVFPIGEDIISKEEFKEYMEKLLILKQKNNNKLSVSNLDNTNKVKYEGIFYIEKDNEKVLYIYNCAYSDSILLQGKLYLTNKKIVFYSWFNGSTLFGKTLLEIPFEDVTDIQKTTLLKIDNSIQIKTKYSTLDFHSFGSRNECFSKLNELVFNIKIDLELNPSISNKSKSTQNSPLRSHVKNTISFDLNDSSNKKSLIDKAVFSSNNKSDSKVVNRKGKLNNDTISEDPSLENLQTESNLIANLNNNEDNVVSRRVSNVDLNSVLQDADDNVSNSVIDLNKQISENYTNFEELEKKYNLKSLLNETTEKNLKLFYDKNKRKINEVFYKDVFLSETPINYVFDCIYNPDSICESLDKGKNFLHSFKESVKDTGIDFSCDKSSFKIPSYMKFDKDNHLSSQQYQIFSYSHASDSEIKKLVDSINSDSHDPATPICNYTYKSNHPIPNPKFMGPKKLDVSEEVKVYSISPTCMIADHYTNLSGFMMMDTFYIVTSYIYKTDYKINHQKRKIEFATTVTVEFTIEFIKSTYFQDKITKESMADNKAYIKSEILFKMEKALKPFKDRFHKNQDDYIKLASRTVSSALRKDSLDPTISNSTPISLQEKICSNVNSGEEAIKTTILERVNEEINNHQQPLLIESNSNSKMINESIIKPEETKEDSDFSLISSLNLKIILAIFVVLGFIINSDRLSGLLTYLNTALLVFLIYKMNILENKLKKKI